MRGLPWAANFFVSFFQPLFWRRVWGPGSPLSSSPPCLWACLLLHPLRPQKMIGRRRGYELSTFRETGWSLAVGYFGLDNKHASMLGLYFCLFPLPALLWAFRAVSYFLFMSVLFYNLLFPFYLFILCFSHIIF